MGHVMHSGSSGERNTDAQFFMLGWALSGFHKKRSGTRFAELVLLHLVGYSGDVVHSGASLGQNIDARFFLPGWDRYGFNKNWTWDVMPNLCFCIWWDL
jgi:hypothetical protein